MIRHLLSIAYTLVLAGCLGNDIVVDPEPAETISPPITVTPVPENPEGQSPAKPASACSHDPFCRLENPTDTLSLSSEQKARARQLLDDTLSYTRAGILRMDTSSIEGDSLRLEVFPDVALTVQLKDVPTTNPDSRNLTGEIVGDPGGSVMLSFVNGNLVLGSFQYGEKAYSLFSLGDGLVLVQEVQMVWPVDCADASVGYACD